MTNIVLEKALKFKVAAERGDEQVRDLARTKYLNYLKDNSITDQQVIEFEKSQTRPKSSKKIEFEGKTFHTGKEFEDWYMNLSVKERMRVAFKLSKNKIFKK